MKGFFRMRMAALGRPPVIAGAKRGDIGSTGEAYARAGLTGARDLHDRLGDGRPV